MTPDTKLSFGWPLLRKPLMWTLFAWIASTILLTVSLTVLIAMPGPWDGATALKVCSGLPVVQKRDGSIWLRDRWRAYRVKDDNPEQLC